MRGLFKKVGSVIAFFMILCMTFSMVQPVQAAVKNKEVKFSSFKSVRIERD